MLDTLVPALSVLLVAGLVLTIVGAGAYAVVRYVRRRMAAAAFDARIAAAPLTPLGKLRPDTDVRALGRAEAEADAGTPSLTAPMSGRACIAWQITLERGTVHERQPHAPSIETWEVERVEDSGNVVELHDEGVRATLRLPGAEGRRAPVAQLRLQYELDQTDAARAFFARNGIRWEGYLKPLYRLTERILEAGTPVCVFGQARLEGALVAGGGGYRDAPAQLVLAAAPGRPLVLLEAPSSLDDAARPATAGAAAAGAAGGGRARA